MKKIVHVNHLKKDFYYGETYVMIIIGEKTCKKEY